MSADSDAEKNGGREDKKKSPPPHFAPEQDGDSQEVEYVQFGGEIEIDDDVEVEFVDAPSPFPPPPFGFPPPPRGMFPPPPPQISIVETYDDADGGSDSVGETDIEFEQPDPEPQNVQQVPKKRIGSASKLSEMMSEQAEALKLRGEEQAERVKRGESSVRIVSLLKILLNVAAFCLLAAGCFFIIDYYRREVSKGTQGTAMSEANSIYGWRLGDSRANNVVREYFESLGDISLSADFKDALVKGTLEMNGVSEDFYCIKRSNGRIYLRLGSEEKPRAYFIGLMSEGSFRLPDLRSSGRRIPIPEREALVLRALVSTDEMLFKRAFGDIEQTGNIDEIAYDGFGSLDGADVESVSIKDGAMTMSYSFGTKDRLMRAIAIRDSGAEVVAKLSDYRSTDDNLKHPMSRTVLLNGKEVAKVSISLLIRNKGFLFP